MILYRYEDPWFDDRDLTERRFRVMKETPGGYWIMETFEGSFSSFTATKRWVSKIAKKRFAWPTQEEAVTSYVARRRRQIEILESKLAMAKAGFFAATGEKYEDRYPHTLLRDLLRGDRNL